MNAPKTLDVVDFIGQHRFQEDPREITENDRTDHCEGDNDGDYEEDL